MEKLDFKKQLVQVCKSIKNETETNLLAAIADAQQSANEYGQPKDRYDSYRAQLLTRRDMLAQQLERVQNEIGLLDRIDLSRVCDVGGFGSVVVTPVQKVFISIGIGKISMEGMGDFYAISASVPFAQAVKEKKAGDTVVFNGKKLEILEVY
ncbi:MAG: hypothetical protein CVT94_16660 [Bacteroidetes bacterium HGW-Bacteroidetes-11]|jgi:hypothetical protein|nr:MAG: hypothetical protein CVT94_16660 [Bacteroidetes bacterium HGW-Bacteroidetes-11]